MTTLITMYPCSICKESLQSEAPLTSCDDLIQDQESLKTALTETPEPPIVHLFCYNQWFNGERFRSNPPPEHLQNHQ